MELKVGNENEESLEVNKSAALVAEAADKFVAQEVEAVSDEIDRADAYLSREEKLARARKEVEEKLKEVRKIIVEHQTVVHAMEGQEKNLRKMLHEIKKHGG